MTRPWYEQALFREQRAMNRCGVGDLRAFDGGPEDAVEFVLGAAVVFVEVHHSAGLGAGGGDFVDGKNVHLGFLHLEGRDLGLLRGAADIAGNLFQTSADLGKFTPDFSMSHPIS